VLGEVVGGDEAEDMCFQAVDVLVVEDPDGCFLDGSVHPLGLTIGPGMVRFGQSMFDALLKANAIEDVWPEEAACWSLAVPRQIGEGHAVVGEDLVYLIRKGRDDVTQEGGPFDFAGVLDDESDRRTTVRDLIEQGYGDAYRQFIEPVVAAGDRIEAV